MDGHVKGKEMMTSKMVALRNSINAKRIFDQLTQDEKDLTFPRFFIGIYGGYEYLVPVVKRKEWDAILEKDMGGLPLPEWALQIDLHELTFCRPRIIDCDGSEAA